MRKFFQSLMWGMAMIDFFSITPSSRITFQNERIYSSCAGKTMTIVVIMSFLGSFFYFGINMMTRASPNTIIAEKYKSTPDFLNITKETFFLAFGMKDSNGSYESDPNLFIPNLQIVAKNKSNSKLTNQTKIEIGLCTKDDIPQTLELQEYFRINDITGMFCIKNYQPVEMMGSEDSDYYEYIQLTLQKCDIKNESAACQSDKDLSNFMNTHEFTITFTSYAVDSLNYLSPLNQHGNFFTVPSNEKIKAQTYFYFQHLNVETDDGLIFKSINTLKAMTKSGEKTYFAPIDEHLNFIEVIFSVDKVVKYYERTYDKLQQVLANTGGALQMLTIAALILTRPIIYFNFYRDLGNTYFDFDIPEQSMEKPIRKPLEISFYEYLWSFLRVQDSELLNRRKIFDKAKSLLNDTLSLSQILNKLAEFDKMKYLLFDSEQLLLFEYIPKPVVGVDSMTKDEIRKHSSRVEFNRLNESFFRRKRNRQVEERNTAYRKVIEKKMKTEMDAKFLKVVEMNGFEPNFGKSSKNTKFKINLEKAKISEFSGREGEGKNERERSLTESPSFRPILPRSEEDVEVIVRENVPMFLPHIDVSLILKDLESIEEGKRGKTGKKKEEKAEVL